MLNAFERHEEPRIRPIKAIIPNTGPPAVQDSLQTALSCSRTMISSPIDPFLSLSLVATASEQQESEQLPITATKRGLAPDEALLLQQPTAIPGPSRAANPLVARFTAI